MKNSRIKVGVLVALGALVVGSMPMSVSATAPGQILPGGGVGLSMNAGQKLEKVVSSDVKGIKRVITKTEIEDIKAALAESVDAPESEEDTFKRLVIAQVTKYVNVRDLPSEVDGNIVGKLYNNSVGSFIEEVDGWYKITSGNVTGFVKGEFCVTGEDAVDLAKKVGTRYATVTTTTLKVRQEPSLEAAVIGLVPFDEDYVVNDETDEWVKIDTEDGEGWISKEFVSLRTDFVHAESKEEEEARLAKEKEARDKARAAAQRTAASTTSRPALKATTSYSVGEGSAEGKAVAEYALQFVGNPYVWGGTSLTNGCDCSGFVMSVYANFGVELPHSSKSDRTVGSQVDGIDQAEPGDLICYSGHVAMYIGNGQIVHAASKKLGIIVSNADYNNILAIRRLY